ncbi:heme-binding protein [uncultured Amnibacterium sp.]|uniref:GlcG/HbpS family heme-binding protein n=1 Tax=uncultured Amnibacterium sp. TaxID=1631851 RepID=UPI0035CA5584
MPETRDLPLADARALIARAIDKAEQLGLRGGIAVVGATGALVSTSRMDRGGAGGMARARSKAWISATQQIPSAEHLGRMNFVSAPVEKGFVLCSPEAAFPGAGGMPVLDGDEVVGGIAASGATVSPFFPAGVEQQRMIADGRPANPEDLLIHYALRLPYAGQHGDDDARWARSFGPFPDDAPAGLGMAEAPRAALQTELDAAIRLADAALAAADRLGARISVAVVDRRGDPIQQDSTDGAATAASFLAPALAAAAATFELASEAIGARWTEGALARLLPFPVATVAGGLPWTDGDRVRGGLGVAGPDPLLAAEIARAALADAR